MSLMKDTFNVYTTVCELLMDRGYKLSKLVSIDEFSVMYEENNYDIIDVESKIYCSFFTDNKTFGKKDLEGTVSRLKEKYGETIKILVILKTKPNVIIEKELTNEYYKDVEIFLFANLTFNITHHNDMPKFVPLSQKEMTDVINLYKTNKNQFPKMLETDPVARYYGVKSGGMFKIIRQSPSAGEYITYRYVK